MPDFLSLGISEPLTRTLADYGIVVPTPIQAKAIPVLLEGKDLIAQAQTGTGKTLAFILPILEKISPNGADPCALIVTPTRELAIQIHNEIKKLINNVAGINVLAVYGGQEIDKQLKSLEDDIQIVVGTPGRLLDHLRRGTIKLTNISYLVIDEADQMLQIGFLHEVEEIIKVIPASRQSMLFSATIPEEIKNLANTYMRCPLYVQVEKKQGPALNVKQLAIYTTDRAKQATLIHLIRTHRPFLAVIFCRTKRRVTKLYEALKLNGFRCDELHGDLSQAKREQVMKHFRDADIQLLIATDVAARGLDVEGVTHVFNYDIPLDSDSYVHRVGRTGRAGMKGIAITLYTSKDRNILDIIEKELHLIKKQDERSLNKSENKQGTQRELTVNKKAISRNKKQVLTDPKQTHQRAPSSSKFEKSGHRRNKRRK